MDSRDLIRDKQDQNVLIDSHSIDRTLGASNGKARKILQYQSHDSFSYVRSPFSTSHELLSKIEEYEIEPVSDGPVDWLTYAETRSTFRYTDEMIEAKQRRLEDDDYSLPKDQLQVVAVCRSLNELPFESNDWILVTDSDALLRSRFALESEFAEGTDTQLNIMSLEETAEFLGLFMRYRNDFRYYPEEMNGGSMGLDFTVWCWTLPSIIIPHMGGIDGLGARLENLVIGVDELGYQYYSGSDNSTNMKTRYHFDHIISLVTGVLDSLAIHTRDKYELDIENKQTSIRTGGRLFSEIRELNEDLWSHIEKNHHFVELIYVFRPLIIHRDGVMGGVQESIGGSSAWTSHYVGLDDLNEEDQEEFEKYYHHLDDELLDYDPLTKWGLICRNETMERLPEKHQLIEPYQFIKTALRTLAEFVDEYLRILGFDNRLDRKIEEADSDPVALHIHQRSNIQKYMMSPLM